MYAPVGTFTAIILSQQELFLADYFYPIAQALVEAGWKRNVNIRGAPYDFRRAPSEFCCNIAYVSKRIQLDVMQLPPILCKFTMFNKNLSTVKPTIYSHCFGRPPAL